MPKPTRRQRKRSTSEAAAELSSTTGGDSDTELTITARDLQGLKVSARQRQGWLGLIAEAIAGSLDPNDLAAML